MARRQEGVDSAPFCILVHVAFEIALVAALALNWRGPLRRTLLLAGLGIHVIMRAWTFAYFVPEVLAFMSTPPEAPFSPELAGRARLWGALGWVRRALIVATSFLVLLALMTPVDQGGPNVSRERAGDGSEPVESTVARSAAGMMRSGGWSGGRDS